MESNAQGGEVRRGGRVLVGLLLVLSAAFYVAGLVHLRADFPNGSPWNDWSKMTHEGWYAGAAIHHFVQGRWYLPDSFNPAVEMPVWPVMLGGLFAVTGVSMIAARTLTMLLYGISLVLLYRVAWRARPGKVAAVVVLLTVINPLCYAFDRLAVLEPVTVFWMMLALWLAGETRRDDAVRQVLLGVVIFLLVLTKMTGVALVPAVLYMMWAEWGWPGLPRLRRLGWREVVGLAIVVGTAAVLWAGYLGFIVRPHYLADYRFLLSINAYRAHLGSASRIAWVTLKDGLWVNPILFPVAVGIGVLSVAWLRALWRMPLFGAAVIAIVGQLAYVGYHANFQPRYYEVIAMPVALVVMLGVAGMWDRRGIVPDGGAARWIVSVLTLVIVVAAVEMGVQTVEYVVRPVYSFWEAAQGIAAIIDSDGGAANGGAKQTVLLSDSGDDITLWTGVPAVCESYSLHGLDAVLNRYKPGWYAAWPGWEDDAIQQVGERYKLDAVARYRVFDDPLRQTLVLYKLTPR